jgi:hypothetical protein
MTADDGGSGERVPTLLTGRTAWGWMRLGGIGLAGGALSGLGIPLATLLPPHLREPVMLAALAVVGGFCALAIWAGASSYSAIQEERLSGYTTLYGRYWELWQLDHRTGEVLRRPGEREVRRHPRG